MSEEQFVYVKRPSKRRAKTRHVAKAAQPVFSDLLQRTRELLVSSGWWHSYRAKIVPVLKRADKLTLADGQENVTRWKCLCLGLGRPTMSIEARAQLCLLLDLCIELDIAPIDSELFDPAFEDADVDGLRGLGMQKGAYVMHTPTLVFMPHCGIELYERFLRANWSSEAFAHVLLVANDLQSYVESTPARKLEAQSPCIARLAPRLVSTELPTSAALPGAFNNTALQVLGAAECDKLSWALPPDVESGPEDGEVW